VIEKFNSQGLQSNLNSADCNCAASYWFTAACFHVSDRIHVDLSRIRYMLLIDACQSARAASPLTSPPRPRLEAVRIVDMSSSNAWAEFSRVFVRTRETYLEHENAKAELKGLV